MKVHKTKQNRTYKLVFLYAIKISNHNFYLENPVFLQNEKTKEIQVIF